MSALLSVPATEPPPVSISTDPARLDVPWVCRSLMESYWGGSYTAGQIRQALHGSLNFGAYLGKTQVGFVRVVTDGSIFSSVTDVFVEEAHRGHGYGTALMTAVVEHPAVAGTYCILRARQPAWVFYWRHDFKVFDRQHGLMHRMPR